MDLINYFAIIFTCYYALHFLIILFNACTTVLLKKSILPINDSLTILIPVRNEEQNIRNILNDLITNQTENKFQIIIGNDDSTDSTEEILMEYKVKYPFIHYINIPDLPKDWLGKNHNCYNLSRGINSDYILFMDADIRISKNGISSLLTQIKTEKVSLISIFPTQIMKSWQERIVIQMMYYLLLSMLPLRFIKWIPFPVFAAANGGVMLYKSADYFKVEPHLNLKSTVIEDIKSVYLMKKSGFKCMTLLGNGIINCRMYHFTNEMIKGFSKNYFAGFQYNFFFLMIHFIFILGFFFNLILASNPHKILLGVFITLIGTSFVWLAKSNVFLNILLFPLMLLAQLYIGALSLLGYYQNKLEWKGRILQK